ncbi:MAG TPA: shikimate dehydrogenase [Pirellulaceae bacterium]
MSSPSLQDVVCCLGQPVAGNPTQYMMEKAFAAAGLEDWKYLTCEVPPEKLGDAMAGIRALGFKGANFTIPHKVAAIQYLDSLSSAAELAGAVNCVNRVGDKLHGDNADGKGFYQSLRETCDPAGLNVAILGAGGAARAIAVELSLAGANEITIVNRSPERGQTLVDLLLAKTSVKAQFVPLMGNYSVTDNTAIFINATSVGLGNESARVPVEIQSLRPELIVADVVFNPPQTWLIRTAAERDCRTIDGLGMLVNQAVICFRIWTGRDPDAAIMREALEEFLEI